ncbi:sialate O-acetylesterase [Flavivirga jejuensis]|uniref:Sialate O-acetylesterase n=1 Tax=Flavivirga jejuensis TaxID=870487 RepID=A0ABT8WRA7_9FLAO|nr:sialate O-acetylesterase [Flavivirga jejuensis]MDO5975534.1 sialate O-acetylesterase [Flavivirga jejuensis]
MIFILIENLNKMMDYSIKTDLFSKSLLVKIIVLAALFLQQNADAQKKIFIFAGQSNMAGRAAIEEIDFKDIPNVYVLDDQEKFIRARNPLNLYSNVKKEAYRQRLGPAYSFAKAIHNAYPRDTILLVVNARGGTAIEHFMKGDTTAYYKKTIERIQKAQKKVPSGTLEAIIWHQGESNRNNYKDYLKKLNLLVTDYRNDLNSPKLPIICGQLGLWNPEYLNIRNEISKIETTVPNAFLVSSDGLTNFDEHHFDSKSQRLLGLRYARKYLEIKNLPKHKILTATMASSFKALKEMLLKPTNNYVMVAAHRGDWRHGTENSLQAIEMAIDMGVDIVEIDIAVTADSIPILMHDKTLDRTTNCLGLVKNITYKSLTKCRLKDGLDDLTGSKIPTLEEALEKVKGKILINIDKGEDHIPLVYEILKKTKTLDQAIFSSYYPYKKLQKLSGNLIDSVLYMPKIKHDTKYPKKYLDTFLKKTQSVILQTRALTEQDTLLQMIPNAKSKGLWLWMNTLEPFHSAGHTDEKIVDNPDTHLSWVLDQGTSIIQTDRPEIVLEYLRSKGLHN